MRRVLALFILALSAAPARAAFERLHAGAGPAALSGAYTAVADDVHALFFNPAGLFQLPQSEVSMQYGRLLYGLDDGSKLGQGLLAAAQPLTRWNAAVAACYETLSLDNLYQERTLTLGAGRGFLDGRLGLGLALKQLHVGYGSDASTSNSFDNNGNPQPGIFDPLTSGRPGKSALGADMGFLYRAAPILNVGLAILNFNRPDVGLAETATAPRTWALGAALRLPYGRLSGDLIQREFLDVNEETLLAIGYELPQSYRHQDFFLRAGGRIGARDQRQMNFGFGWRFSGFQIDYAMTLPLSGLSAGEQSHQVALGYKWDASSRGRNIKERANPVPIAAPIPAAISTAPAVSTAVEAPVVIAIATVSAAPPAAAVSAGISTSTVIAISSPGAISTGTVVSTAPAVGLPVPIPDPPRPAQEAPPAPAPR